MASKREGSVTEKNPDPKPASGTTGATTKATAANAAPADPKGGASADSAPRQGSPGSLLPAEEYYQGDPNAPLLPDTTKLERVRTAIDEGDAAEDAGDYSLNGLLSELDTESE